MSEQKTEGIQQEKIDWTRWIGKDHWLSLYPVDHPLHEKELLNDTPHHTGYLVTAMILNGEEIPKWFKPGFYRRATNENEKFIRHPKIDTRMNRDQLIPIIFPISNQISTGEAEILIKEYSGPLFPHQWHHFERSRNVRHNYFIRLICDFFECIDSISDWFSNSESSQIKNIYRLVIADRAYPTFMVGVAKWLFVRKVDPQAVMNEYFTRYFPLQPPIHLAWTKILEEHF